MIISRELSKCCRRILCCPSLAQIVLRGNLVLCRSKYHLHRASAISVFSEKYVVFWHQNI